MINIVSSEEPFRAPTETTKSSTALKVIQDQNCSNHHVWRKQEVFTPWPVNEAFKCNQTFHSVKTSPCPVPYGGSDWGLSVPLLVSEVVLFGVETLNINLQNWFLNSFLNEEYLQWNSGPEILGNAVVGTSIFGPWGLWFFWWRGRKSSVKTVEPLGEILLLSFLSKSTKSEFFF